MLLAIDNGNTNIAFGLFEGDRLIKTWRIATDRRKTDDEYAVILYHLFQRDGIPLEAVKAVALCTVVPPLKDVFIRVGRQLFGHTPWVLEPHLVRLPLRLKVDYPTEVGADRIAASVAAYRRFGAPLIVIDFGTATTFDCISAQGEYLGGAIAPGVEISAEALFLRAAKLPRVEFSPPPRVIGTNTNHSLRSGLIFGYVAMVEGLIQRMKVYLGDRVTVVGTGGLCPIISEHTQAIQHVVPSLVLEGVQQLYMAQEGSEAPEAPAAGGGPY